MKHKMSILFYAKSAKVAKNGLLPILEKTVKLTTTFQSKLTIDFGGN